MMDKTQLESEIAAIPYFYHRIELPHGITTPGWAPLDPKAYLIPEDLSGQHVLDVGAWDGFWSFEAMKRGAASVMAIDDFSDTVGGTIDADRSQAWRTFDLCRSALGYDEKVCRRREMSVYDIGESYEALIDYADCIFCFGVLYHLRHPLLALEKLRKVCRGTLHIETAVLDNCQSMYGDFSYDSRQCVAEFYPGAEYGLNPSNWHVGTLRYWMALVTAAGFKDVSGWLLTDQPTGISECRGFLQASV